MKTRKFSPCFIDRILACAPLFLLILFFVAGTGCSTKTVQYGNLELIQAAGTIKLDQKPLAHAQVLFIANNKTYSYGVTDANGRYSLWFNSKTKGTLAGEKRVEIWTTRSGADFDLLMKEKYPQVERIPITYNKKSKLKVIVSPAESTFDFDLNSNDK